MAVRSLPSSALRNRFCKRFTSDTAPQSTVIHIVDAASGIATIILNNPSKFNMLTEETGLRMMDTVAALKAVKSLRAVVITGAGKAFSAGGDLQFLEERTRSKPLDNVEMMKKFYSMFLCIRSLPVPTIAAINGPAIGAGLCFAAACDVRMAANSAKIGWTFATLGVSHTRPSCTHVPTNALPVIYMVGLLSPPTWLPRAAVSGALLLDAYRRRER